MKMTKLGFRLQANPETDEADLNIFDDIGEYESWWTGATSGYGPKKLTAELAECSAKKINVHINSMGGDIYDGIAILNVLKGCGKTVHTIVDGMAASAASIIAMAGEKVVMYETSQMMLHNCWTYACGNAKELRKLADDMDKIMASAKLAYLSKSDGKLDKAKLDELLDAESYLTASECKELGLCDEIADAKPEPEPEGDSEPEEKNEPKNLGPTFHNEKKKCWFF